MSVRPYIDNLASQLIVKTQKCYFDAPSMLLVMLLFIFFIPEVNIIIRNLILKRNKVSLFMYKKDFLY